MKKSEAVEVALNAIIKGRLYICNRLEDLYFQGKISFRQYEEMRDDIQKILRKRNTTIFEDYTKKISAKLLRAEKDNLLSPVEIINFNATFTKALRIKYCKELIAKYKQEETNHEEK